MVIAGISLPTSIISLTREPNVVNNDYYNTYYNQTYNTYYNQTYYGTNETELDYTIPLETTEHYDLTQWDSVIRNFTLSTNYAYWCHFNASISFGLSLYILRGTFLDRVLNLTGKAGYVVFLDKVRTYQTGSSSDEFTFHYTPPFLSEWLFIYVMGDTGSVNITLRDEILKI
jgi:hypothetical protein